MNRFLDALPPVTRSWTCKWFLVLSFLSFTAVALGLTIIPGVFGVVTVVLAILNVGYMVSLRRREESCGTG